MCVWLCWLGVRPVGYLSIAVRTDVLRLDDGMACPGVLVLSPALLLGSPRPRVAPRGGGEEGGGGEARECDGIV